MSDEDADLTSDEDADQAERLNDEGNALKQAGDGAGAELAYRAAIALVPEWAAPHYNLGLLCKYAGRWAESLEHNQRASELDDEHEGAWWNLAIAATALGRWGDARRAWAHIGLPDPGEADPPDYGLGRVPLRLDPDGYGEVVWGVRLDPARARIESVPLPTSAYRYDDIVLNDGAPQGERIVGGRKYHVFDVLERLVPSRMRTFIIELASVDEAAVAALRAIAERAGGSAENWGESTRILCRDCSYGRAHEHDAHDGPPAHPHCGLAMRDEASARAAIDEWLATNDTADLVTWYEAG